MTSTESVPRLLGGRLADFFGLRRIFTLGLVAFCGASLAGGLANSPSC
ncbi:hypothetical protein [Saccharopolyspora elongata]